MNSVRTTLRYGLDQQRLVVTVQTEADDASVSDRYLTVTLPQFCNPGKNAWMVEGCGKTEIEVLFSGDALAIGLQVKVTAGSSSYPVHLEITGPDGTNYHAHGMTGTTIVLSIPLVYTVPAVQLLHTPPSA